VATAARMAVMSLCFVMGVMMVVVWVVAQKNVE
jgi:hypothetical protein